MKNDLTTQWNDWLASLGSDLPDLKRRRIIKLLISMLKELPPDSIPLHLARLKIAISHHFNEPLLQHRVKKAHGLILQIQETVAECQPKPSAWRQNHSPETTTTSTSQKPATN